MPPALRCFAFASLLLAGLSVGMMACAQDVAPGDPIHGKNVYLQTCMVCHSNDPPDPDVEKQGPTLYGVVGRHSGSIANFKYSEALTKPGVTWDAGTLDQFLTNPGAMLPGTRMTAIIEDESDRHDLIAYLKTLRGTSTDKP
jgi:cytochrome c